MYEDYFGAFFSFLGNNTPYFICYFHIYAAFGSFHCEKV